MKRKLNLLPQLKELVNASFEDKFTLTEFIIDKQLRELGKDVAVAWSGGKDSTIVLYLVLKRFPEVPVIFNNTGVEYPETIAFVRDMTTAWNLNLIETKPTKTFWQCVEQYGWPMAKHALISHKGVNTGKCCYWIKEKPMKEILKSLNLKGYFTGTTASENRTRMFVARDKGTCYETEGYRKIHPILYWTENEVWNYAKEERIRMNDIYFKGADRCGCATCTAFMDWESQLSKCNPKLYAMVKLRKDGQYVMNEVAEKVKLH